MKKKMFCQYLLLYSTFVVIFMKIWLPTIGIYFLISDCLYTAAWLTYSRRRNSALYTFFGRIAVSTTVAYSTAYATIMPQGQLMKDLYYAPSLLGATALLILLLLLYIFMGIFLNREKYENGCKQNDGGSGKTDKPELYEAHTRDLDKLKDLLRFSDIIGVNGAWGSGKTFLIDYYCKQLLDENVCKGQDKYYIIKIEVLMYKYQDADKILISRLCDILADSGLFSAYSMELSRILSSSSLGHAFYSLIKNAGIIDPSLSSVLIGFSKELQQLKKPVIVVFEDLERAGQTEYIKRILAITERLACDKVKVIYEYDRAHLVRDDLTSEYLNKYIPIEMNLTEISYHCLAKQLWDEMGMEDVNFEFNGHVYKNLKNAVCDIFTFLRIDGEPLVFKSSRVPTDEYSFCKSDKKVTSRQVKAFFAEILAFWKNKKESDTPQIDVQQIHTILAVFMLKYFYHDWYEKLRVNVPLDELDIFWVKGKTVSYNTFNFILKNPGEPNRTEIFEDELNQRAFNLINLFRYNDYTDFSVLRLCRSTEQQNADTRLEDKKAQEYNNKINHVIWNLLQNGVSFYTVRKNTVECFKKIVLNVEKEKWGISWFNFCQMLSDEKPELRDIEANRQTVELLIVRIAESIAINEEDLLTVKKFGDFYINGYFEKNTIVTLGVLNAFSANEYKIFEYVASIFEKLNLQLSENSILSYTNFLRRYMWRFFQKADGYQPDLTLFFRALDDFGNGRGGGNLLQQMQQYKEKFTKEKDDVAISFISKNIEIIQKYIK